MAQHSPPLDSSLGRITISFPLQPLAHLPFVLETVAVFPIHFFHTGCELRALSSTPTELLFTSLKRSIKRFLFHTVFKKMSSLCIFFVTYGALAWCLIIAFVIMLNQCFHKLFYFKPTISFLSTTVNSEPVVYIKLVCFLPYLQHLSTLNLILLTSYYHIAARCSPAIQNSQPSSLLF